MRCAEVVGGGGCEGQRREEGRARTSAFMEIICATGTRGGVNVALLLRRRIGERRVNDGGYRGLRRAEGVSRSFALYEVEHRVTCVNDGRWVTSIEGRAKEERKSVK